MSSGKSKTTVVNTVPAPTPEELEDKAIARAINQQNLYDQGYELQKQDDGSFKLIARAPTTEEQEEKDFQAKVNKMIQQRRVGGQVKPSSTGLLTHEVGYGLLAEFSL